MFKIRRFAVCALFVAMVAVAITTPQARGAEADEPDPAAERQRALIDVLQSDAPPQDKAITCKKLALYGDKDAVDALAALLSDEQLTSWARIALEAIPGAEADGALREAMGKLKGRSLVGVINSIGVRRDAKAVDALAERLKDADSEVASSAAVALGRIGDSSCATILQKSLAAAPPAVRSAVAEGLILCAERTLAQGDSDVAVKIFDTVRAADLPRQRILEATRGAILARNADGMPLLVEQLQSDEKDHFALGLRVARELADGKVADALVAELQRATAQRQVLLILALADRNDAGVLPAVLQAMEKGSEEVRVTAIGVVQRLGDATCVPVLLEAAMKDDANLSQTALSALADLPGKDVDDDLASRLAKAEGNARKVLIELAGRRGISAATAYLTKAADDPDANIRTAALTALGFTADLRNLSVLIDRVANPPEGSAEAEAAEAALRAACERMPDRDACATRLAAAMSGAPTPVQVKFLEILTVTGGAKSLQVLGVAAKGRDPELQDAGSRLLGEWVGPDAAPVLLDLAQTATERKYKIRALRGYIRIPRQFEVPAQERAGMCRAALKIAERIEEKKLVLEVLERYPNVDMLQLALEAARDPSLKDDATRVSLVIAQKIGGSAEVQKLLLQFGQKPMKVEIIKAEYGTDTKSKDVTEILRRHVRGFPMIVLPSPQYNSSLGGDPVPGVVKTLKVQYRIDGKDGEVELPENATIVLPLPK